MVKTRILLVEDSEQWRQFVRTLLGEQPVDIVGEVADGFKAVKAAEQLQPDVVLLDVGLPGLNGLEACGWICRVAPQAKVLFLTEQRDGRIVHAAISRGAWGYVLKSEATQDLVPAIRALLLGLKFITNRLKASDGVDPEQCS